MKLWKTRDREIALIPSRNVEACDDGVYDWATNGNPQFLVATPEIYCGQWLLTSCTISSDSPGTDQFTIWQDCGRGWENVGPLDVFPDDAGNLSYVWKCCADVRDILIQPLGRSGKFSLFNFDMKKLIDTNRQSPIIEVQGKLHDLYRSHHGKVSDKWSVYIDTYERHFAVFSELPIRLLEIGVQNGGSLEIWSKYFSNAVKILGCDVDPNCAKLQFDDPRISIVVGDANVDATQQLILSQSHNFDLILDDGSHHSNDIIRSFARYFPHVNEGGLFIIEDLHCSYWQDFQGGLFAPHSAIAFFKRLADIVNFEHWGVSKIRSALLESFGALRDLPISDATLANVHSVEFLNSTCVVRKNMATSNVLGPRVIAGQSATVFAPSALSGMHSFPQDQSNNLWSTRIASAEEDLEERLREIDQLRKSNEELTALNALLGANQNRQLSEINESRRQQELLASRLAILENQIEQFRAQENWYQARLEEALRNGDEVLKRLAEKEVRLSDLQMLRDADARANEEAMQRLIGLNDALQKKADVLHKDLEEALRASMAHEISWRDRLETTHHSHSEKLNEARDEYMRLCEELLIAVKDLQAADGSLARRFASIFRPSGRAESLSAALALTVPLLRRGRSVRLVAEDSQRIAQDRHLPMIEPMQTVETLRELLTCSDEVFVQSAYHLLLGRTPDVAGRRFYLTSVRDGVPRIEILSQIYSSEECRARGASLDGLDLAIKRHNASRFPLIGYAIRALQDRGAAADSASVSFLKSLVSEGLRIRETKNIEVQADVVILEHDSQVYLELDVSAARGDAYGVIEVDMRSLDGTNVDPKIYLGPGNALAVSPHVFGSTYRFLFALPSLIHEFQLQLSSIPRQVQISALKARSVSGRELFEICATVGTENRRMLDIDYLHELAVAQTLQLNQGVRSSGGMITSCESGLISGLVWDRSSTSTPVVQLLIGDRVIATGAAESRYYTRGMHAFKIQAPVAEFTTSQFVTVRIQGREITLRGSPLQVGPISRPRTPNDERLEARLRDVESRLTQTRQPTVTSGPLVSILTPVYNVEEVWLTRMIESVVRQSYQNWELCLVDDNSTVAGLKMAIGRLSKLDRRIKVVYREANGGISAATNDALSMATGEYVALLDNDDMLTCDALESMVEAITEQQYPDWLYSDECKIDENDRASQLFTKPDWSPCMLLNYMYTGHLSLYKTALVRELGGFRSKFDFSQDYDLALRMSEVTTRVAHVEKCLYGWRMIPGSGAQGDKPGARRSNIAALQSAVDRRGWSGKAIALPTSNRVVFGLSGKTSAVSIIIPSDNLTNIQASIDSILITSTYGHYEIIVVTNSNIVSSLGSRPANKGVVWRPYDKAFNFSDKCNAGAAVATGDVLIFFNDDVRVVSPNWIECLVEYLTLPGVGVVGPKLLYENGTIQHAGMVTGVRRLVGTAFHAYPADSTVHFNLAQCVREVSLICGALLAMPSKLFRELNGWDAENAAVAHSDVDLCCRVREAGYRCVYTPFATLIHIGHASLAEDDKKEACAPIRRKPRHEIFVLKRFGPMISRDPYFPKAVRDLIYLDSQEEFLIGDAPKQPNLNGPNILIVSHELTNSGAPRVVFNMAEAFIQAGCYVVVTCPIDGPLRQSLEALGVQVIVDANLFLSQTWVEDFSRNFDKVVVNTIIGWPVVKQIQEHVETYWYIHEAALIDHIADAQAEFRDFLPHARNVLAVSHRTGDYLARRGVKYKLLPTGVGDRSNGQSFATPSSPKVRFGVFGGFETRKGQDIASHAFRLLPKELADSAELHLFGRTLDASFEKALRETSRGHTNIHFNGEAQHPEYFEKIREMDVVVIPSRDEPMSLVALDAMAEGRPVLCSSTTGIAHYLVHGESGFIAQQNTAEYFRDAFAMLIVDDEARREVGAKARTLYVSFFTIEAFRQRLFEALDLEAGAAIRH